MSRVDHPDHYQTSAGLEAIDVIEAFFYTNSHLSNVFKCISRAGKKGDYAEDLEKAKWYLEREIERHANQITEAVAKEMGGMPIIPCNPGRSSNERH